MFKQIFARVAIVCLISVPVMTQGNWVFINDTGYFTENNGVWTNTNGSEGNIWVDMELQNGQKWNLVITEHTSGSGFIVYGIHPMSRRQEMIDCPTCRNYWNSASVTTDDDAIFLDGQYWQAGNHPGIVGDAPIREQNVGHIWTLTYTYDRLVIDNSQSGGNRVLTLDLDPNERYFPFSMVQGVQSHYYDDIPLDQDCIQWGNECLTPAELQECYNHLGLLSANGDSVDSECNNESDGQITYYNFEVTYNEPFYLHDCLTQEVYFEGSKLLEGDARFNEWTFDVDNQTINFSIQHLDLEAYGCILAVSDEEYEWQCYMQVDILFAGSVQYTYEWCMKVVLSRVYTDTLTVNVERNYVEGDCCENELSIETALNWCETFECLAYLSSPLTVERKQDMFVEHSIVTTEFQYYYLHGLSIKLGPFVPTVWNTDGSQPGRYIWHITSNVAMGNMELVVISRIDENPSRRALVRKLSAGGENGQNAEQDQQEQQIRDDYKVKAAEYITVYDTENNKQDSADSNNSEGENKLNTGAIAAISVVSCLLVVGFVLGGIYFFQKRTSKNESQSKYQVENGSSQESVRKLSIVSQGADNQTQ